MYIDCGTSTKIGENSLTQEKKQTPAWEYTCGHLDHKNVPGQSCPVSKTHINALDFFRSQTEFLF